MKSMVIGAALAALPVFAHAGTQALQAPPWKLSAARDSFAVTVNGRVVGSAVFAVDRTPQGFRVTETTHIAGVVQQTTEMLLDDQQLMLSVSQKGETRGQETRIELRYERGRVRGFVKMPGPQGQISSDVDSEVPADVVDDNLVQGVVAALPWSPAASYTMPVFSSGKNALSEARLSVVAMTEDAYKVELASQNGTVHFYVSRASPQRILRIAPAGQPIELVRVN